MKFSWIKEANDKKSFKVFKGLGLDVFDVENPNDIDKKIEEIVDEDYHTIIMSNELAGFSEDIIKKYGKTQKINILIAPPRGR